jgi:hypothetical protein
MFCFPDSGVLSSAVKTDRLSGGLSAKVSSVVAVYPDWHRPPKLYGRA